MNIYDLKIKTKTLTGTMLLVAITIDFGFLVKVYIGNVFQTLLGIVGIDGKSVHYTTSMEKKNFFVYEKDETHRRATENVKNLLGLLDKLGQPTRECNHTEFSSRSKAAREGVSKYAEQYRAGVAVLKTNQQAILSVFNSSRLVYE